MREQDPEQTYLPDGRPNDGSGSETGLAPLVTNVDDFLLINDTAGDNRTQLFMASEFPALPNWRMDNNLGSLQFLQFGGVGSATRVTIADGGDVGIGTNTPLAPLHVVDTTPGPGSHAIIADEGDLLLHRSGATAVSFRFFNGVRAYNFFNSAGGVFQLRDVNAGTSPFVLFPGVPSNQLVLRNGGIGINNINPTLPHPPLERRPADRRRGVDQRLVAQPEDRIRGDRSPGGARQGGGPSRAELALQGRGCEHPAHRSGCRGLPASVRSRRRRVDRHRRRRRRRAGGDPRAFFFKMESRR